MSDKSNTTISVLTRAEEILSTAKLGYEDMQSKDKNRRYSGLRNLIVFGRSVTFVLQNLSSIEAGFQEWYEIIQDELKSDPLMKYFVDVRNNILKQGKMQVSTSAHIKSFSTSDIAKFGPPPPGAKSFFMGDEIGGCGWLIELADGTEEKYYVEVPTSIAEVKQVFPDLPETVEESLKNRSIEELCEMYLAKLESVIDKARKQFLKSETQTANGKRLPPYLKIVK
jgi:hypothetical protein